MSAASQNTTAGSVQSRPLEAVPPARTLAAGRDATRRALLTEQATLAPDPAGRPVLITGGAGFIGTNVAKRLLSAGHRVLVYDNLSRVGVQANLEWLRARHGDRLDAEIADVRDARSLAKAVRRSSRVFHFAAQVAVTTSLVDPIDDFEVNARGTLNLLEALRRLEDPPPVLYTSTNKVYGGMDDVQLRLRTGSARYEPADADVCRYGFGEDRPLDFHSPYGCSKGAADQYVRDFARTFGVPAAVFRMSCVYGPHQCGTEDQGWVAHFLIRAIDDDPITVYGDGMQVRDVLYVEDLVDAMLLAQTRMGALSGRAFNIGGGPANTLSLLELLQAIGELRGCRPGVRFDARRPADQHYYVSDIRAYRAATGWRPKVSARCGVERLYGWLQSNREAPAALLSAA